MPLTTRSASRNAPPNNKSSSSRAVQGKKAKPLVLRKGLTRKPARKSARSTSTSSKKEQPKKNTAEVESHRKDDLVAEEDIYKALSLDSDESDSGDLDSDNEVLEALAQTRKPSNKPTTESLTSNTNRPHLEESQNHSNPDTNLDDLTSRLEAQFANSTSNPMTNIDLDEEVQEDDVLPTIESYKGQVKEWPRKRITSVQELQKKVTSVPPHILAEAKAIKKLYKHHKRMLAMMGNITPYTLDKSLGDLGGTRVPDAYRLWLKFSVEARNLKMPRRTEAGEVLGRRNRKLGAAWKAMSANQRRVFHPRVFYTLSGLPVPDSDINSDHEENGTFNLSPEDHDELQGIYEGAVCSAKVCQVYAKASSGIPEGPTAPKYNQLSLKCVEKLHTQIKNKANRMDFGYYFLASSTHPATAGDSPDPGWCKEFTSNEELADYVRSKANFPTMFAAQTQGISVNKVIASTIGKAEKMKMRGKRVDPGDKVKGELAALLKSNLGFPRGPDPEKLMMDKGWKVKIKQMPGSTLPPEILKLGFNAMNSRRSLWLNDLRAGLFQFEKIPEGQDDMMAGNQEEQLNNDKLLGMEDELGDWNGIAEDETDEV
ncbi:hypothetical protein DFH28DRAFT_1083484 [Melampsora americana]|nr:hypothetical protein DFH28DRAFT_1083484 [Melampsora americana]